MLERIREALRRIPRLRTAIAVGALGLLLIMLSGLLPDSREKTSPPPASSADSTEVYREQLETRLTDWLNRMEGVGEVQVMITLKGSAEQQFAEEVRSSKNDRGVTQESEVVLTRTNGSESALVARTASPEICGVAVLCSGGAHAAIRERVSEAVRTVLGVPASAVYVGQSQ